MTEAFYRGEWNDSITNNNPQMDGRGIREIHTDTDTDGKTNRLLHIGNFESGKASGFGLHIDINDYGSPNQ